MFDVPVETKKKEFFNRIAAAPKDKVELLVMHIAQRTPEMEALVDMNNKDQHSDAQPLVAMHRSTELSVLLSPEFQQMVKNKTIQLVTYRDLVQQNGLDNMKAN
jgi:hypothetical protein